VIEQTFERLYDRAQSIGPATASVLKHQAASRKHIEETLRCAQGILRLAHDFTPERLEVACQRALVLKAYSYRAVRTLLQTPCLPPTSPALDLAHENVRGAEYFQ
jgi:hypothetical protein